MRINEIWSWIVLALLLSIGMSVAMPTYYDVPVGPYNVSFTSLLSRHCSFGTVYSTGSESLNPTDPNSASVNYTQYTLLITAPNLGADFGTPELVRVSIRRYNKSNNFPIIPDGHNEGERFVSTFRNNIDGTARRGGCVVTDLNSSTRVIIMSNVSETLTVRELETTMHIAPFDPNYKGDEFDRPEYSWENEQKRILDALKKVVNETGK